MAKFTVKNKDNYSIICNCIFKDSRLSWKAKGILSNMLALPDNWDYSLAGLEKLTSDGMSATRSALKELEDFGYLIRRPIRDNGRIKDWEYLIFEEPQQDYQVLEKPLVENQQVENQTELNNINNKIINNKIINNKIEKEKENKKEKINYQQIVDMYNETCVSFPKCTVLSDARKKSIKARFNTYKLEDFKKAFTLAEESNFLKGGNDRNWIANFDWVLKDSNFAKILDGNYANKNNNCSGGKGKAQKDSNAYEEYKKLGIDFSQFDV